MAWKFIITSKGAFRLGDVRMHRDLLLPGDQCLGGGYYQFDYVNQQLVLEGASYDYGSPQWSRLKREGLKLQVSREYEGFDLVYRPTSRQEEAVNLNHWLGVEWK